LGKTPEREECMNPRDAGMKNFHRFILQPFFALFGITNAGLGFRGRKTDPEKFYKNRRRVQVWRMMR
jgi:hypothetical protein